MDLNDSALGPYEGAFASAVLARNLETLSPFASAVAGPGALRAGPGGLLQGRFGYGNPTTGLCSNAQQTPGDALGIVIPLRSVNGANGGVIGGPPALGGPLAAWTWQTWDRAYKAWRLREGIVCTLMPRGNFWLRFAGGGNYGQTVYASLIDGSATVTSDRISPPSGFVLVDNCKPGSLARVSSSARFY